MKNTGGFLALIIIAVTLGFGCSVFGDDYDHLRSVEQSGEMICIVKARYSAEYKVSRPLSKADLFLFGNPYKSEEFPDLVVRNCDALNDKIMYVGADGGGYLWSNVEGEYKLKKLSYSGMPSNDLPWYVDEEKRVNVLTSEEIAFKAKLPSYFIGNSPDWKTIITEGENLVEKDLISLYVVDVETGAAKKRFVRRANYLFLLDSTHGNAWIGRHFGWVPDAGGKFQLVYPVLEPDEIKK
jgi:hypothetical protein